MHLHYLILGLGLAGAGILLGVWLGWQLLRQNGRLLLRLEELEKRLDHLEFGEGDEPAGLTLGSEAPAFELPDLAGKRRTLEEFRGQPLLLVFFNPACGFCREMMPELRAKVETRKQKTESEPHQQPQVLIVSAGNAEANRQLFAEHQVFGSVLLQKEMEVAATYRANGTPSGYLIDPEGKIASELAMGAKALLELFAGNAENRNQKAEAGTASGDSNGDQRADRFKSRSLERSRIRRDGLKAGAVAPDFRLPRLDGRGELALNELRGRRVLLVFSSPTCGPCVALAPQLEKFHRDHPEVVVLMISKGQPKENRVKVREYDLTFPIVLQQQWEISRLYAMFATPVAYLIDEEGTVTRDVAVGTDAILDLMSRAGQGLDPRMDLVEARAI